MDWTQVWTIIGVILGALSLIAVFLNITFNKFDIDIRNLDADIRSVDSRLDGWMKHSIAMQAEQTKRMDQFYQMFANETKDFHGRLERLDSEFKNFMMNQKK